MPAGPLLARSLSQPARTSMALIVVCTGFAKTAATGLPPIPAESEHLDTLSPRLNYLNSLKQ